MRLRGMHRFFVQCYLRRKADKEEMIDMESGRKLSHCGAQNALLPLKDRIESMSQEELNEVVPSVLRAIMAGCTEPNAYACTHKGCANWVK